MHTFMRSFLTAVALGLLVLIPSTANAVNNKPVDKNDPIVKCQEGCKVQKSNESYEACMMECKKKNKKPNEENPKSKK